MIQLHIILGLIVAALLDASEDLFRNDNPVTRPTRKKHETVTGEALVDYVNKNQQLFEAEYSPFPPGWLTSRIMDKKYLELPKEIQQKEAVESNEELPESFDAREKWPDCASISTIRDQSACGSCWAVSAASVMSDRVCIQSQGRKKTVLSDTEILTCCDYCYPFDNGCIGGYAYKAWEYAMNTGICTGGRYKAKGVCAPYILRPCGKHRGQTYYGECPGGIWNAPECKKLCQPGYITSFTEDKTYAESLYSLRDIRSIQKEIMTNGPVQAGFTVYDDLKPYKGGVYVHNKKAEEKGGHAVKVIGWGIDNGTEYWLIANSWSSDWGDNGFFRILRGKNECGIESGVIGGMMEV